MSNYRKTMAEALREMYPLTEEVELDEVGGSAFGGTIDKIQKVVDDKQATKIDGVMVDTFTASLIMKIWNGVSKQNQDKMRKMKVTQLAKAAYKLAGMKEEVDLDEAIPKSTMYALVIDGKVVAKGSKSDMMRKKKKEGGTVYNTPGSKIGDKIKEEVDLDEGTKQVLAHGGKGKYKVTKDGDKIEIKFGGKVVGTADFDRGADSFFVSIKGEKGQKSFDDAQAIADYFAKNKITEEVELDEDMNALFFALWGGSAMVVLPALMLYNALPPKVLSKLNANSVKAVGNLLSKFKKDKNYKPTSAELDDSKKLENEVKNKEPSIFKKAMSKLKSIKSKKEEVGLDEGKMSQLHQYIKDKKSPEEIAKLMKLDVKTIKALMNSHHPEEVEEGAAADARRAMRADPDMRQKFSKDVSATDDDVKGASKNIMMQMRKAQSLNGRFDVEFADGKKVKIPAKMAIAVQSKYNKMRRPAEKEKFQAKIAKSYRDMLSALKEEVKPKKESVLDRIDKKIKENKDG